MYVEEFSSNEDVAAQYAGVAWEIQNGKPFDRTEYNEILQLLKRSTVHLAWYGCGHYEGSSVVIYEHRGQLYEVNGGHCSCYGLEGQWSPERTSWELLRQRDISGHYDTGREARDYLHALCDKHINKG